MNSKKYAENSTNGKLKKSRFETMRGNIGKDTG